MESLCFDYVHYVFTVCWIRYASLASLHSFYEYILYYIRRVFIAFVMFCCIPMEAARNVTDCLLRARKDAFDFSRLSLKPRFIQTYWNAL